MTHSGPGPLDEVGRLLSQLPRERPPEIPIDAILRRLAARRRAVVALAVAVLAAGVLLLVRPAPRPPVHLPLRVVDVEPPEGSDGPGVRWAELP